MSRRLIILPILSGLLLTASFPTFSLGFLGWVALIPFFYAIINAKSVAQALQVGFITGLTFFATSLYWMVHVHVLAWFFLVPLETFFFVLFAWFAYEVRHIGNDLFKSLWLALAWTTAEWIRAEFPIFGFGWNLLAYSQSDYLPMIQFANVFGAYGLGFLMAWVNAVLMHFLMESYWQLGNGKWQMVWHRFLPVRILRWNVFRLLAVLFVLAGTFAYGKVSLSQTTASETVRVSTIQGNIPQKIKWELSARPRILEIYNHLTELSAYDQPDLILWPEAAFPGYFNRDFEAEAIRELSRSLKVPILVGSPHLESKNTAYNSAYLLDTSGQVRGRYDKQFLVPFGEYVPLQPLFGWLEPVAQSLGISDFKSGNEPVVFSLPRGNLRFSTLICFEDVFPNLARKFVDAGAQVLGVITNDAWFGNTSAPFQHLQASIFRAVENGVSVMRAANTGVSGFISPRGKVLELLTDEQGNSTFVTGRLTFPLPTATYETLYRKGGWLFAPILGSLFLCFFFGLKGLRRKDSSFRSRQAVYAVGALFLVCVALSGCIRFTGGATYWKKGPQDEAAQAKSVGFDTNDFVPGAPAPGDIEVAEGT